MGELVKPLNCKFNSFGIVSSNLTSLKLWVSYFIKSSQKMKYNIFGFDYGPEWTFLKCFGMLVKDNFLVKIMLQKKE